jgi:hypothetical protein
MGRPSEARARFAASLQGLSAVEGDGSIEVARTEERLARALVEEGRVEEARKHLERAQAIHRASPPGPLTAERLKETAAVLEQREGRGEKAQALRARPER